LSSGPNVVTIAGVVDDVHLGALESQPEHAVFIDARQMLNARRAMTPPPPPQADRNFLRLTASPFQTFFIRTEARTAFTIQEAVKAVVETDPTMRPRTAATLEDMYGASIALRRFQSWLFGGFAAAALVVVGVGILGLLAMSAARRTREVGIRCTLGATPGTVATLMVREQLGAVGAGLLAGGAVAAWAVGFVEGYLYQLTAKDPRIWGAAVVSILAMAAIGTLVPAIRASRTDPLKALRTE
jgi:ABC-type antimicrobial peptide transport system permease subunit